MSDWSQLQGDPAAPLVGPFPHRSFLETWRDHRAVGDISVLVAGGAAAAVVVVDGWLRFAGEPHVTDYHTPLGDDPAALVAVLLDAVGGGAGIILDSLPSEAADPLEEGFVAAGVEVLRTVGEACQVIDFAPADDGGWEKALRSKYRHELRRKRRRFTAAFGAPELERSSGEFDRFVTLHRGAGGPKGGFMTDEMAAFFGDLLALPEARLDVMRDDNGSVVAAAFGFEDDDAYYLYNSAFDAGAAELSPGIVLVDLLIRQAIDDGRQRFDFLKGAETYKRRFGAVERLLYRLEVTL